MFINILFLILGLLFIIFGSDYFIAGSSLIAKRFGIPKLIIGLTLVALGTSAPEFGVNIVASIHGHNELALGNILGSNISNILLIFALASIFVNRVSISKESLTQISFAVLVSFVILGFSLLSFGLNGKSIIQAEGFALLFLVCSIGFICTKLQKLT